MWVKRPHPIAQAQLPLRVDCRFHRPGFPAERLLVHMDGLRVGLRSRHDHLALHTTYLHVSETSSNGIVQTHSFFCIYTVYHSVYTQST
ncbi:MAG: hypothetical protein CYG59_23570 [Chloroflexi bacterium]|nr:MAG: hypothetical protein CYG59_23570 [Chloroflexota bacterium]